MGKKLHKLVDTDQDMSYVFHCPGCEHAHRVRVKGESPVWGWNGSLDSPSFKPSILIYTQNPVTKGRDTVCHSFVTDGKIRFLGDCLHKLKGQTVELPDWEE